MTADLETRTRRGVVWSAVTSMLSQAITFGFGVALARLLMPEDFGFLAAIVIFLELGSSIVSSGLVAALVACPEAEEAHYSTATVLGLIMGVTGAALLVLIAPWVGAAFREPKIGHVLAVMSAYMVILPFISIPTAKLRRRIDFRSTGFAEFTQQIVSGTISVALAYCGWEVWSLVYGRLGGHVWGAVYLSRLAHWTPRFRFETHAFSSLFHFSLKITAANILNDMAQHIGFSLVGRLLGSAALGLYSRANYLMTLPLSRVTTAVNNVLYSAFAEARANPEASKRGLLKATCYVAIASNPILTGLFLTAPALIHSLYGEKWMGVVEPLRILCFAGVLFAVEPLAVSLITARGYVGVEVRRQLIYLVTIVAGMAIGSRWGLAGIACAVLASSLIFMFLLQRLLLHLVQLSFTTYIAVMVPSVVGCAWLAVSVLAYQFVVRAVIPPLSLEMLITSWLVGAVTYVSYMVVWRPRTRNEIASEVIHEIRGYIQTGLKAALGYCMACRTQRGLRSHLS